ncbi:MULTISPECIES: hypothetical protein [Methylomonas]|uniref:hypothetical protein n=1 Tax=Methylomonas TaxID=416 RepID=UPI0012325279|nr:hypothetical protein [Methylomonas rhizoryzae]
MKKFSGLLMGLLIGALPGQVLAYGSGSGSVRCDKPEFSNFDPAANKYVQQFREFSFVASANTTPASIEVNVSAGTNKYHFNAKQLVITPQRSGRFEVSGKLDRPFQHGFVRLSVTAHTKPNCIHTDGYLIRVQ